MMRMKIRKSQITDAMKFQTSQFVPSDGTRHDGSQKIPINYHNSNGLNFDTNPIMTPRNSEFVAYNSDPQEGSITTMDMYDSATWRMYYRIMNGRKRKSESLKNPGRADELIASCQDNSKQHQYQYQHQNEIKLGSSESDLADFAASNLMDQNQNKHASSLPALTDVIESNFLNTGPILPQEKVSNHDSSELKQVETRAYRTSSEDSTYQDDIFTLDL